jgi:hypothetical protein
MTTRLCLDCEPTNCRYPDCNMGCKYVRDYYNVPACIGRRVTVSGRNGIKSAWPQLRAALEGVKK